MAWPKNVNTFKTIAQTHSTKNNLYAGLFLSLSVGGTAGLVSTLWWWIAPLRQCPDRGVSLPFLWGSGTSTFTVNSLKAGKRYWEKKLDTCSSLLIQPWVLYILLCCRRRRSRCSHTKSNSGSNEMPLVAVKTLEYNTQLLAPHRRKNEKPPEFGSETFTGRHNKE